MARPLAQGHRPGRRLAGDRLRRRVRCSWCVIYWLFHRLTPGVANRGFRLGQLFSGTWVAFTHGANDAQKTMGVIALALYAHGSISSFYIPTWVKIAAGLTIAAGTYVGGWRIIRTLGQRIYKMQPEHGFAAQLAAGTTLYAGTRLGFPISTTHVVSGSVMGAGATRSALGRALGRRRQHRLRLAADDPGRRARRRCPLLPGALDLLVLDPTGD